jgi:formylglycine-generating enzyme required for sulfatase activity
MRKARKNAKYFVLRGGSYFSLLRRLRSSYRPWNEPEIRYWDYGLRLVARKK